MFWFGWYKKIKSVITKKDLNPLIEKINENTNNISTNTNNITSINNSLNDKASLSQDNQFHGTNYFNSTTSLTGNTNITNVNISSGLFSHTIEEGDDKFTIANKEYVDNKSGQVVDLSNYYNKDETNSLLETKADLNKNNSFSGVNSFTNLNINTGGNVNNYSTFMNRNDGKISWYGSTKEVISLYNYSNMLYIQSREVKLVGTDGTSSISLTNLATPTNNNDAVNKQYVDNRTQEYSSKEFTISYLSSQRSQWINLGNFISKYNQRIKIYINNTLMGVCTGFRFYYIKSNTSQWDMQFTIQSIDDSTGNNLFFITNYNDNATIKFIVETY